MFESFRRGDTKKRRIPGEDELPARKRYDAAGNKPMQIRHPHSFADVEEIIDRFKDHLTVIVYLQELSSSTAMRVIDMLSGAIYALGGGMAELQKDMYIFNPDGVDAQ